MFPIIKKSPKLGSNSEVLRMPEVDIKEDFFYILQKEISYHF